MYNISILNFADYSAPYEGNFIKSLINLEEKLIKKNINLVYLFPKPTKEQAWAQGLIKKQKKIYFLTGTYLKDILLIIKIMKTHKIKIIHTHFSTFKYDAILKISRILSKKPTYIRHMHMVYKNKNNFLLEKIKRFVSNADIEIACSQVAYKAMKDANFNINNLYLIVNAIDFLRLDKYKEIDRKDFAISSREKIILMFAYNYYVKGVDIAIKAVKELIKQNFNIRLLIIVAKNEKEISNRIIEEEGEVPNYINILPPRNDIGTYYKMADIFLSASRKESFCYAIREAAYLECLTVASNILAHKMTDKDITFENENYKDLAEKLKYALTLRDKDTITLTQKEFVIEQYSIDKWSDEIIKLYLKHAKMLTKI